MPGDLKLGEGVAEHLVVCTYMLQLYLQRDFYNIILHQT